MSYTDMKPVIDQTDVEKEFHKQLVNNTYTTTLDVKKALREKGYWATQSEVSWMMADLEDRDPDISFSIEGNHRAYYLRSAKKQDPVGYNQPLTTTNLNTGPKPLSADEVSEDDWVVSGDWIGEDYYSKEMSAGRAKYEYSKRHNIPFTDARIRRYKE